MILRIAAIVFIFICMSVAWFILGGTVSIRTSTQDSKLKDAVGQLWGTVQRQKAPLTYYETTREVPVRTVEGNRTVTETRAETKAHPVPLEASNIGVDLSLEHRRKGLLWYSTYRVKFSGDYRIANPTEQPREILVRFIFPTQGAVYDEFKFSVGDRELRDIRIAEGSVVAPAQLGPGQSEKIRVSYQSQGMDEWWYDFGSDVSQVKNFSLTMHTDFEEIDFPQNSIAPTEKERAGSGWIARWKYSNLLSGVKIGMVMPHKLNPGPWVSRVSYSAPVSLFLFFFLLLVFTTLRNIKVHPMNYFFIGCGFFTFHLLLAYLADHISIHLAFVICSAVSIFLVVSYMRLVVGRRFAFVEIAAAQFVYLVLFSYTFFLEEYTGLAITILCTITLFIVMQMTGRLDWESVFDKGVPAKR